VSASDLSDSVANEVAADAICKTPIIASITPSCPLHLASRSDLLSSDELKNLKMLNLNRLLRENSDEPEYLIPPHLKRVYDAVKAKFDEASNARATSDLENSTRKEPEWSQLESAGINNEEYSQEVSYSQFSDSLSVPNKFGSLVRIKEELIQNDGEEEEDMLTPLTTAESSHTETNQSSYLDTPTMQEIKLEKVLVDPFHDESVEKTQDSAKKEVTVEGEAKPSSSSGSTSSESTDSTSNSSSSSSSSGSGSSTSSSGSSSSSSSSENEEVYDSDSGSNSSSSGSTTDESSSAKSSAASSKNLKQNDV
jgi:hypothetical protein